MGVKIMTRKDYQLIADVLKNTEMSSDVRSTLAMNFAVVLKQDNPNFKPVRFCQATRPAIADSPAIKANNAKGFES
jgi:hypothetical protein|tara:strand:- start:182 stop:409 length:228 start_codon:yes stop_codon:yes gene_type:complete